MTLDAKSEETASDSEAALWRALKLNGSAAARDALFSRHLAFARQIAARHFRDRSRGDVDLADLQQLACAGLLEAIDGYDPEQGAPFRPYARRRITGSILDGLAKSSEVRQQIAFRSRMRAERLRSLARQGADTADTDEAMQALVDLAIGLALGFMLEGTGLYLADGEREIPPRAYESLAWKQTLKRLGEELDRLEEREQIIIRRHYLDGLDFAVIGELLGLSGGRISQLHREGLERLQKRLRRSGDFKLER